METQQNKGKKGPKGMRSKIKSIAINLAAVFVGNKSESVVKNDSNNISDILNGYKINGINRGLAFASLANRGNINGNNIDYYDFEDFTFEELYYIYIYDSNAKIDSANENQYKGKIIKKILAIIDLLIKNHAELNEKDFEKIKIGYNISLRSPEDKIRIQKNIFGKLENEIEIFTKREIERSEHKIILEKIYFFLRIAWKQTLNQDTIIQLLGKILKDCGSNEDIFIVELIYPELKKLQLEDTIIFIEESLNTKQNEIINQKMNENTIEVHKAQQLYIQYLIASTDEEKERLFSELLSQAQSEGKEGDYIYILMLISNLKTNKDLFEDFLGTINTIISGLNKAVERTIEKLSQKNTIKMNMSGTGRRKLLKKEESKEIMEVMEHLFRYCMIIISLINIMSENEKNTINIINGSGIQKVLVDFVKEYMEINGLKTIFSLYNKYKNNDPIRESIIKFIIDNIEEIDLEDLCFLYSTKYKKDNYDGFSKIWSKIKAKIRINNGTPSPSI